MVSTGRLVWALSLHIIKSKPGGIFHPSMAARRPGHRQK